MPADSPDLPRSFAVERHRPASFLHRGLALPLTSPSLLGGRIRPAGRGGAELVLADPAGGEASYILPWPAVAELCAPTLHDRALWRKASALRPPSPRSLRAVARAIATEGYAGREAARAALAADQAGAQARILLHYHLLIELVRQGEAAAGAAGLPLPEQDSQAQLERRARAVLARLREGGSPGPGRAVDMLEELATVFEGIGLRQDPTGARLPRQLAGIGALAQDLAAWAESGSAEDRPGARLLAQGAALALRCGRQALEQAFALLDDIGALLHRWALAPAEIREMAARPDWLLDGWETICELWRATLAEARTQALPEMARLLPPFPAEAEDWLGFDAAAEMEGCRAALRLWWRRAQPGQGRPPGRLAELIRRNEALRAMAA